MNKLHYLFHITAYYIAWFGGILLAAHGKGWLATVLIMVLFVLQLLWQIFIKKHVNGMASLILGLTLTGTLVDSALVMTKVIVFASNPFAPYFTAPWMIAIWMSFSILFYSTLGSLFYRFRLLAILAFVGFSLSYFAGARMGAASFPSGNTMTICIGLIWAILFPLCLLAYKKWITKK